MKKLSILLCLCLALALGGCSLLREEAAPGEDRLVGVYVTPEYIDTFDFEAYFGDNASKLIGGGEISAEDAAKYSQRVYAVNDGGAGEEPEFPMWGVPLFSARYGEGEDSYVSAASGPCLDKVAFGVKYTDELAICTLSGAVYCAAGGYVAAYCNPDLTSRSTSCPSTRRSASASCSTARTGSSWPGRNSRPRTRPRR